ncbi:MAG: macro domain-containing protein [Gemmatimonadales bacterium]|nr:macro domain-containing protein [Gemmatimonadales bacterium]
MIRVVVDDLAFVEADALVRPATATLEPVSPSLRRLEQLGGPAFVKQIQAQTRLAVGAAVVTAGGDLAPEFVIHAVIMSDEQPVTPSGVRRTITSIVQRAVDWELARITTPLLGVGPGNLTPEDATRILVDTLASDMQHTTYPKEVCIVVESEEDREMVEAFIRGRLAS